MRNFLFVLASMAILAMVSPAVAQSVLPPPSVGPGYITPGYTNRGYDGESSASMKIRGVITISCKKGSRLKITKKPFRLRDEPLLIQGECPLEYRRRPAEGADKNTTTTPRLIRRRRFPLIIACKNICGAKRHVRSTPNSDHKSRHQQTVMSALPPKADMCSAVVDVCKADT